jgi:hypothetical protein
VEPQWGDVAVVDVKTSAVKAWVSKIAADEVEAPTIENALGLLLPSTTFRRAGRRQRLCAIPTRD